MTTLPEPLYAARLPHLQHFASRSSAPRRIFLAYTDKILYVLCLQL